MGTYTDDNEPVSCNNTLFRSPRHEAVMTMVLKAEEEGPLVPTRIKEFWPSFNPPTRSALRARFPAGCHEPRSGMPRHDAIWRSEEITNVDSLKTACACCSFSIPTKISGTRRSTQTTCFCRWGGCAHVAHNVETCCKKSQVRWAGGYLSNARLGAQDARHGSAVLTSISMLIISLDTVAPAGSMVSTAGDLKVLPPSCRTSEAQMHRQSWAANSSRR